MRLAQSKSDLSSDEAAERMRKRRRSRNGSDASSENSIEKPAPSSRKQKEKKGFARANQLRIPAPPVFPSSVTNDVDATSNGPTMVAVPDGKVRCDIINHYTMY